MPTKYHVFSLRAGSGPYTCSYVPLRDQTAHTSSAGTGKHDPTSSLSVTGTAAVLLLTKYVEF